MVYLQKNIFKKSSKTFYYSTLFFPKNIQSDVCKLYAFVRTADDYVDSIPQDSKGFYNFKREALDSIDNSKAITSNIIIQWLIEVYYKYNFKREWVVSFLEAMESDLWSVRMKNKQELEYYMYGSAAVVWYMMCAIFWIRDQANLQAAQSLAYAMQCINFIRDVDEDNKLWRRYLYNNTIYYNNLVVNNEVLPDFIQQHLELYFVYFSEAQSWLLWLPLSFKVAVLTASDAYHWTAKKIHKNPSVIFERKIKPSKIRVILFWCRNLATLSLQHTFQRIQTIFR